MRIRGRGCPGEACRAAAAHLVGSPGAEIPVGLIVAIGQREERAPFRDL